MHREGLLGAVGHVGFVTLDLEIELQDFAERLFVVYHQNFVFCHNCFFAVVRGRVAESDAARCSDSASKLRNGFGNDSAPVHFSRKCNTPSGENCRVTRQISAPFPLRHLLGGRRERGSAGGLTPPRDGAGYSLCRGAAAGCGSSSGSESCWRTDSSWMACRTLRMNSGSMPSASASAVRRESSSS